MAINVFEEDLVPFSEGKRRLPRSPSYERLYRWATLGVVGFGRKRVYLERVKVGSEPCTSVEAFKRFCDQCSDEDREEDEKPEE